MARSPERKKIPEWSAMGHDGAGQRDLIVAAELPRNAGGTVVEPGLRPGEAARGPHTFLAPAGT
ncbi:hypothetical protein GCM10010277_79200 [Streptomyces longisporoflavus]|uniref:hypothetical protein n=1 Tax=Streptomyces longisporoflavus TaxID=28044 RepID=UPI00167D1BE2|nr:hypothetical protein [Streptomyces longisporoflavus]GGV69198.1 hypothetical protein GCM10010277_79200 [Streptomyces longisporoflavus]